MIVLCFTGNASIDAHYCRIQRFFSEFQIDFNPLSRGLCTLFFKKGQHVYRIIERTNWFWSKAKVHVFRCSIAYEGLALPILWTLLPKTGSSSAQEQISLLTRFIRLFARSDILGLLADREFANPELFAWCKQHAIPFYRCSGRSN